MNLDGIRAIAYLEKDSTEIRNKCNLRVTPMHNLHRQVKERCILDGEIIVMQDGVPDFAEIHRRSLMSKPIRIALAAERLPATFVAYDIVQLGEQVVTELTLLERKELLRRLIKESPRLAISQWVDGEGIELYNLAVARDLEGIVAKRKDSRYRFDKRSDNWIKVKNLKDQDFYICGYELKDSSPMASVILAAKESENKLIYRGHVLLSVTREDFKIISRYKKTAPFFPDKVKDAVWIEPDLLCTVSYMQETAGGLRQPVFKALRIID